MKSTRQRTWSVGEVAQRFVLPTNVLRHWESVGLLTPRRDSADRRRYTRDDISRVAAIQRNKAAGMSLEQIASLLRADAPGRHDVLTRHLADLEFRMVQMEASRRMTEHALSCRAHDLTTCPGFQQHLGDLMADFE